MLSFLQVIGGANLVNRTSKNYDQTLATTESFSLCFRFYLRVLGTIHFMKRGTVIQIPGLLSLEVRYPLRSVLIKTFLS